MPASLPPCYRVFNILEVGLEILEYASWTTFVALCNTSKSLGRYAQPYVSRRVKIFLGGLVGVGEVSNLLAAIKASNGCIIGGVPRCIMADPDQLHIYQQDPPKVVDIVVPNANELTENSIVDLLNLLVNRCGYTSAFVGGPDSPHCYTTSLLYVFLNKVSTLQHRVLC